MAFRRMSGLGVPIPLTPHLPFNNNPLTTLVIPSMLGSYLLLYFRHQCLTISQLYTKASTAQNPLTNDQEHDSTLVVPIPPVRMHTQAWSELPTFHSHELYIPTVLMTSSGAATELCSLCCNNAILLNIYVLQSMLSFQKGHISSLCFTVRILTHYSKFHNIAITGSSFIYVPLSHYSKV